MRLKDIRGLPVVDPTAARKIGTVADYLVDPATGRLAALEVAPAGDGDGREGTDRIPTQRIRRIGQHAVVLTGRPASVATPTAADTERWLDSASLVNLEVLGDDGNRVGHLTDASFDQDSLDIQAYLLRTSWWERLFGRHRGRILPGQVTSCSRELMIVNTGRLGEAGEAQAQAQAQAPAPAPEESNTPTDTLGVPLKLEDRVPPPSRKSKATDGPAVPTVGRAD
jgi:sporulation protein YlmC with PRC-barrel domain